MTEYHDIPRMSQSKLKLCWDDPALFAEIYIHRTRPQPEPTPAMQFGIDAEQYLFDGKFSNIQEIPESVLNADGDCRGKRYTDWRDAQPDGIRLMKPREFRKFHEPFKAIQANIEACPNARHLVYGGKRKVVILWSYMDVEMKSEIDLLTGAAIGDFKTASDNDPESFSSQIANLGLDIQAATYQLAVEQETGKLLPFIFVVARNKPSYSVELIECSEKYLRLGRERLQERIEFYKQCVERNEWRSPTWNRIIEVEPPAWFERQMNAWNL